MFNVQYSMSNIQHSILERKSEGNTCRGRESIDEHPEQLEPRGAIDSSESMDHRELGHAEDLRVKTHLVTQRLGLYNREVLYV